MSVYAIGDIQGCFDPLRRLLDIIQFDPAHDELWLTGDLVNRGSKSLDVLRFIYSLGDRHKLVLGNHDLHLLAVALAEVPIRNSDTFRDILSAPDRDELLYWLKKKPLLHVDEKLNYVLTHAGIAPLWDLSQAKNLASEVSQVLQSSSAINFLIHLYGNEPARWDDQLTGFDRLRCITNYFTRMRFCYADGALELSFKGAIEKKPSHLLPWFALPSRKLISLKIIFGHWAALGGVVNQPKLYALDTGCVWGNCLTAMRLEDEQRFNVACN